MIANKIKRSLRLEKVRLDSGFELGEWMSLKIGKKRGGKKSVREEKKKKGNLNKLPLY